MNKQLTKNNSTKAQRRRQAQAQQAKKVVQIAVQPKRRSNGPNNGKATITSIGRGLRNLGGFVGGAFGQPGLGRLAGSTISRIFGQGDYLTNAPVKNSLMSSGVPAFGDMTSGFRVKHREYLTDITSSTTFAYNRYPLNPGLSNTFPWLSTVAQNFEEYIIHGCVIYLNTTSGASVASTNTALGLWGVVTQYDPSEAAFVSKQEAENYVGCQSAIPSQSLMHGVECKPRSAVLEKRYIRTGDLAVDQDIKFYDWGVSQIFTTGSQNANVIGELWISYDIEFFKPRLHAGGYLASTDKFQQYGSAKNIFGTALTFGRTGSNVGCKTQNNTLTFPARAQVGYYLVEIILSREAAGAIGSNITYNGSVASSPYYGTYSNASRFPTAVCPTAATSNSWHSISTCVYKSRWEEGSITYSIGTTDDAHYVTMTVTLINGGLFGTSGTATRLAADEINLFREFMKLKEVKSLLAKEKEEEEPVFEEKEDEIPASTDVIH